MKRFLSFIAASVFLLSSASCAVKNKDEQTVSIDIPQATGAADEIGFITDAPFSGASEYPSVSPQSVSTPFDEPTDTPTSETTAAITNPTATANPTAAFTAEATASPTSKQSASPTSKPSASPTPRPSASPTPRPSASPTPRPSASPTPKPTAAPTPKPTSVPSVPANIGFTASASLPIPSKNEPVPFGQPLCFGGVVKSDKPILSVKAVIVPKSGSPISYSVDFPASANVKSVELFDRTFPSSGNKSLTAKVKFESLPVGDYTFELRASTVENGDTLLLSSPFSVVKSEWIQLISNHFRNNYAYALNFFGSRDEFMFRFKWTDTRSIMVEPSWLKTHFAMVASPSGKEWCVHKKAAASYKKAIEYLKNTYIHVGGASESGVIPLWELVSTFDGTLNTRFVSDRTFISHHSFGTAIDINASMDANRNVLTNRELILNEVKTKLLYNGIKQSGGKKYYDFTYTGSHASTHKGVATTVINYLLYELAFYRAGFGWGYYYPHACDGMHFSLSELSPELHNSSSRALRKVFSYID